MMAERGVEKEVLDSAAAFRGLGFRCVRQAAK